MVTIGASTEHGPAAVMESGPPAVMLMPPGVSAMTFAPACRVMLAGVMIRLVVPTCRVIVVGDIAWMPAGESITVLCGPTGEGGAGRTAGGVGADWIVTDG